ncbi:outer membrane lipoprotein-sorting protein [Thermodesulfobacteriota bacterium]
MKKWRLMSFVGSLFLLIGLNQDSSALDPQTLVKDCFNYMRGEASFSTIDMTIHRPDWQRVMKMKAWTRGESDSLIIITSPPKDDGNGTLKKGREMWMFNPKVNRIIKLPPSMMSQAWLGSDFSNNDLAKTDSLIKDYEHRVEGIDELDGKKVYRVRSIPKPEAPVVWGMLKLRIREDLVLLAQHYYDEDLEPVKSMTTSEIMLLGGKLFPRIWVMKKTDAKGEYTELKYHQLEFKRGLPKTIFTLSNLKNPRR